MKHKETHVLIFAVFIAGLCSIIYELLIATASSYFLGDSIKQFSLTIGSYMAAMGIGSYLSRFVGDAKLLINFIRFELVLGLLGGLSVPLLYLAFAYTESFQWVSIGLTIAIGILIGLEIPLLSRLMEKHYQLSFNISNVLSVDYLGALIATLIFPFILLPAFGTFKTSLFFGLVNMSIAFVLMLFFSEKIAISHKKILWIYSFMVTAMLGATFIFSNTLLHHFSDNLYDDRIVYAKETPYQKIVMTKHKSDLRLFLNGNLQFSSKDEYRYHESLVHVPLALVESPKRILMLGGGDGLGVREVLKYPSIESITLVDLDPAITQLAMSHPLILALNKESLDNPRVKVINQDAFKFLLDNTIQFDAIIIDLPDPNNASLARLYSKEFYRLIRQQLTQKGVLVTQATSPFFANKAFWTIFASIKAGDFGYALPYHANVPSFGDWGFIMATANPINLNKLTLIENTQFLSNSVVASMFTFGKDKAFIELPASTLDHPLVLIHYLKGFSEWD
ncbi:MAG: polyamine aminopropyltransferase [Cellvibrionales bacterium]|nr:polyamine aminopropyltransferase [Cellvibrionales bacterium]